MCSASPDAGPRAHTRTSTADDRSRGWNRAQRLRCWLRCKCYDEQFKLAANQFKAGQISRIEFQDRYNEIRSGLEETSFILNDTATTMAKKDGEYQQALAEPYTTAQPATKPASSGSSGAAKFKKGAAGQAKTPSAPAASAARTPEQANVATQASEWKTSREDLENTRQDVNSRMSSYERAVNNLLG